MRTEKIGIVGSGLIGRAWCMLFTAAGYRVQLYDVQREQMDAALQAIEHELHALEAAGTLRGTLSASEQFECISLANELGQLCTPHTVHIQECVPESLALKQELYRQLDALLAASAPATIVCSSTSTFMPSLLSEGLAQRQHILVAHPLNPPYCIPLVELVPAPWTSAAAVERTRALMLELGQRPVVLKREVQGFATNRIQYAILAECWHLVAGGVLSASDLDAVMTHGLGMRYAHAGPLETAHLNANGIDDYFARYGREINAVCATYAPPPNMNPQLSDVATGADSADAGDGYDAAAALREITRQCELALPKDQLPAKRDERTRFLNALARLKQQFTSTK